jgi:hypothetical protein
MGHPAHRKGKKGTSKEGEIMKSLNQKMKELSPAQRKRVEARTRELIAEEMSLRDLRKALKKTQQTVAEEEPRPKARARHAMA